MRKFVWLVPLLIVVLIVACGKKEDGGMAPEPEKVEKVAVVEMPGEVAGVAEESLEDLFQEEGEAGIEGAAGALAGAAAVAEESEREVSKTLMKTTETVTGTADEMAEPVTRTVSKTVVAAAGEVPETIVIENKRGTVTLPHKMHGEAFGCAACHGDAAPGALELGKDRAHEMCKGCHKEKKGNAPTKCGGCHKRSVVKGEARPVKIIPPSAKCLQFTAAMSKGRLSTGPP